jgi:hypothetical protein
LTLHAPLDDRYPTVIRAPTRRDTNPPERRNKSMAPRTMNSSQRKLVFETTQAYMVPAAASPQAELSSTPTPPSGYLWSQEPRAATPTPITAPTPAARPTAQGDPAPRTPTPPPASPISPPPSRVPVYGSQPSCKKW